MLYSDQKDSFADNRILSATGKFYDLKYVLTDHKVSMETRKNLRSLCQVQTCLLHQAQLPNDDELRKLESCWHSLLRRMVKNRWKRKSNSEGEDKFTYLKICAWSLSVLNLFHSYRVFNWILSLQLKSCYVLYFHSSYVII